MGFPFGDPEVFYANNQRLATKFSNIINLLMYIHRWSRRETFYVNLGKKMDKVGKYIIVTRRFNCENKEKKRV